ncbi:MAG: amidophosphoribosyltransferase [Bacillota bacterium]
MGGVLVKPKEECGVFGIFGNPDAARLTYYGLYALQHRGQESAGIAVSGPGTVKGHKGMGLVSDVFNGGRVDDIRGNNAVGHVRYSTMGSSFLVNAQPLVVRFHGGGLGLAHNGNLTNAVKLRSKLERMGSIFQTTMDTEVVAHLIARNSGQGVDGAVAESLQSITGGYALVLLTDDALYGARDPSGTRPLSLGRLGDAWILASETCAFDTVGAETVRDIEPGEMVKMSEAGLESWQVVTPKNPALCIFEYIYFARPDSNLRGLNVHATRKAMGRRLAREFPVDADLVMGVPDSSVSAASGYAEEAGIPYEMGLVKNRYVGRTFIQPNQGSRALGVRLKLNPVRKVLQGKRVVLVDDSIVRGTTSSYIVHLLKEAGATEVHLRISSPPYRFPCFYGIDTASRGELIAAQKTVEEIEQVVEATSLRYLGLEALLETVGEHDGHCTACFTGNYPMPVCHAGKYALECGA